MKLLERVAKKLEGRRDDELEQEILGLREEQRAFRREHRHFREDALRLLEETIEAARRRAAVTFSDHRTGLGGVPELLADLYVPWAAAYDDRFHAYLRSLIEAPAQPGQVEFDSMSRADFDAKIEAFDEQIRECQVELERRRIERQKAAADAELAALGGDAA